MQNKNNIPKLRFKEFIDEWQEKKLKELCTFTQGIQIPQSEQSKTKKEGYIRYLYIRDFFTDKFPCYIKDQFPNKIIKPTEIMVVNTGNTAGEIFMGATGVLSNNSFKIGFDVNKINNQFLFLYLKSDQIQNKIKSFFNAAGQPHLGHSNIGLVPFVYPCIKEQFKIAGFLTAVDEKIGKLEEKKKAFEKYKKGIMQAIFSQKIRFKKPDDSNYPDWEEKKLGELVTFHRGNSLSKSDLDLNGKYPCIHYGELFTEYTEVITDVKSRTNVENSTDSQVGDILMPTSDVTPQGLAKACSLQISKVKLGGDINILRLNRSVNSIMLSYLLNYQKRKIMEIVSGTTVRHIYAKDLSKLKFLFSNSLEEQEKMAEFLTSLDNKVELINKELEQAKLFKKSLLQQMFA